MFLKYFYSLLLVFTLVTSTAVLAQTDGDETLRALEHSSVWKKLNSHTQALHKNIIYRLIVKGLNSIDSWGADSVELGINDGVIAKVIFTVYRSVEKNYSPSGAADQYLVRDTFKIGMRIGFGYIASGDVSLVRQYSLIYPVATKREGAFHNKFLLNLFLPYQVAKQKLPPKYVLMVEDFLEGRGRLNLGGTLQIPVGLDTRLSMINLHRTFFDAKDADSMLIFEDQSNSSKLMTELYAGLSSANLPLFNASIEGGQLNRTYIRVSRPILDKSLEAADAVTLGMWENNLAALAKFGTIRQFDDTFLEKYHRFTLFGLAYVEARSREDHLVENVPSDGRTSPEIYERYQIYRDQTAKWMWPSSGEKKYKNVVISGEPGADGQVKRASMLVSLRILDFRANPDEIGPGYLHMINTITREDNFLNFDYLIKKGHWGTTQIKFDIYFSEANLQRLQTLTPAEMWSHVAIVTHEPRMATAAGQKELKKHLWKNRVLIHVAHNIKSFLKSLKKFQEKPKAIEQLRALSTAIKDVTYLSEEAYSPYALGALVDIFGKDSVYFFARFSIPDDYLKSLPSEAVLERVRGPRPGPNDVFHPFVFTDAHQIYYFF